MGDSGAFLQDLGYDEYLSQTADPVFLEQMNRIASFSYLARTNLLGGWSEEKNRRVIFRLQRTLQEALDLSGFHNQAALRTRRYSEGVEFSYDDADYGFTFFFLGSGEIGLSRRGSSSRAFHEWYRRFMPSLPSLVLESVATMNEELAGFDQKELREEREQQLRWTPVIRVEQASYNFNVVVDVRPEEVGEEADSVLNNVEVLNWSLLRRAPSRAGNLVDPRALEPDELGEISYEVSRWRDGGGAHERYKVLAPSINNWGSLFFSFAYRGETYVPTVGERRPFDQADFVNLARTTEAYVDFFRDRAVSGFVRGVLTPESLGDTLPLRKTRLRYSTPPT